MVFILAKAVLVSRKLKVFKHQVFILIITQDFPKEYVQNTNNMITEELAKVMLEIHITFKIITLKTDMEAKNGY